MKPVYLITKKSTFLLILFKAKKVKKSKQKYKNKSDLDLKLNLKRRAIEILRLMEIIQSLK